MKQRIRVAYKCVETSPWGKEGTTNVILFPFDDFSIKQAKDAAPGGWVIVHVGMEDSIV